MYKRRKFWLIAAMFLFLHKALAHASQQVIKQNCICIAVSIAQYQICFSCNDTLKHMPECILHISFLTVLGLISICSIPPLVLHIRVVVFHKGFNNVIESRIMHKTVWRIRVHQSPFWNLLKTFHICFCHCRI